MSLDPVQGNSLDKSCSEVISSSCISWAGPSVPGTCKGASLTQVVQQVLTVEATNTAALDLSGIDLGCLWVPTVTSCNCPNGLLFLPDTSAPNGIGYCQLCPPGAPCYIPVPFVQPVCSTIPNPIPKPTTLLSILQLMINKIPCCDPCSSAANTPIG